MVKDKKEFTEEEKALFVVNNRKVNFWADKELVTKFNKICKAKGNDDYTMKDALIKYMQKVVDKHGE